MIKKFKELKPGDKIWYAPGFEHYPTPQYFIINNIEKISDTLIEVSLDNFRNTTNYSFKCFRNRSDASPFYTSEKLAILAMITKCNIEMEKLKGYKLNSYGVTVKKYKKIYKQWIGLNSDCMKKYENWVELLKKEL